MYLILHHSMFLFSAPPAETQFFEGSDSASFKTPTNLLSPQPTHAPSTFSLTFVLRAHVLDDVCAFTASGNRLTSHATNVNRLAYFHSCGSAFNCLAVPPAWQLSNHRYNLTLLSLRKPKPHTDIYYVFPSNRSRRCRLPPGQHPPATFLPCRFPCHPRSAPRPITAVLQNGSGGTNVVCISAALERSPLNSPTPFAPTHPYPSRVNLCPDLEHPTISIAASCLARETGH